MKGMNYNLLKAMTGIIASVIMLGLSASRGLAQGLTVQLEDKEVPVSEFNGLNISDDFDVTVAKGSFSVKLTVDKDLMPYVDVYVRSKTLYLSYDQKAVPKNIKKQYKGKSAPVPVFRVVVYTPTLESVVMSDNTRLTGVEEFFSSNFTLDAADKAEVQNLTVNATSAKVQMKKNTKAMLTLKTDRGVEVVTEGNASVKLNSTGKELIVNTSGSSNVAATGDCTLLNIASAGSSQVNVTTETEKVAVTAEGSSKVLLNGRGKQLIVKGTRSSSLDAYAFPVDEVEADLAGSSTVSVSVSQKVSATLVGGSSLYYSGTPEFRITKIVKSTLAPYGTK